MNQSEGIHDKLFGPLNIIPRLYLEVTDGNMDYRRIHNIKIR